MITGSVQFFDPIKGFGFIVPDDGTADVFIHAAALRPLGIVSLAPGQRLNFDTEAPKNGKKSLRAIKISLVD